MLAACRWATKALLPPDPPCPLAVDPPALPEEQLVGLAPAPAGVALGDLAQTVAELVLLWRGRLGQRRWVERCWPTTLQARRSETPKRSVRATTAHRRASGQKFPSANSLSMSMLSA